MTSRILRLAAVAALVPLVLIDGLGGRTAAQSTGCLPASNLTGRWLANDGGYYIVKEIGTTVWWVGRDLATNGKTWTHAFQGTRSNDIVTGSWVDVRGFGSGTVSLRVQGTTKMVRVASNNPGYAATQWDNHCA